jgi:hypothetical protein
MAGAPFEKPLGKQGFITTSKISITKETRGRYGVFTPVEVFMGPERCYWDGRRRWGLIAKVGCGSSVGFCQPIRELKGNRQRIVN